jgi:hypothetical protein
MKKFMSTDRPSDSACDAALKKFLAVNKRCKEWVIPFEFSQDEMLVEGVKQSLYEFWYKNNQSEPLVSDMRELFLRGRAGPGASISARDTDFYTKMFDSSLSSTAGLPPIWERCVSMTGLWSSAEHERQKLHGIDVVECSRYSFVNKTTKIARGICTEPSINMWFQLGLGSVLEDRLSSFYGVDIKQQQFVNRALARRGSVEGCFSTIDLESASDSLCTSVLKQILPRSFFAWLEMLRCKETQLPSGERVELSMISTMGNGFTFPLETVVFCSIVQSVYRYLGIPLKGRGLAETRNFGVFGDDIIVDSKATRLVLRLLYLLGFQANADKTFVEGRFRESCGADYIDGINIRPVYVKSLKTEQDLFVIVNGLNRWCTRLGLTLARTTSLLLSGIRNPVKRFVPPDEDDSAGLHVPVEYARLANYESTRIGLMYYHARVPREWEFIVIGGACWTYKEQVRRSYNPSGLYIAFLSGNIRGYRVSLRQREVRYTTKRRCTPRWGYLPPRPLEDPHGPSRYRRFVDACDRNLVSFGFGAGA